MTNQLLCSPDLFLELKSHYPAIAVCDFNNGQQNDEVWIVNESDLGKLQKNLKSRACVILYAPDILEENLAKYVTFSNFQYLSCLENLNQCLSLFDNIELNPSFWIGDIKKTFNLLLTKDEIQNLKSGASFRWSLLQNFFKDVDFSDYFSHIEDNLLMVGEELLSNLTLHASPFETKLNLHLGESGLMLNLYQQTDLTSLEIPKKSLERALRLKEVNLESKGAGLGLYLTFKNCNTLLLECQKKKSFSIYALIKKNKRYKEFRKNKASLFFKEN